jgi:hypothetical protein
MRIADAPGGGTIVTVDIPVSPNGNGQLNGRPGDGADV